MMLWLIAIAALILLIIIFVIGLKNKLDKVVEHWVPALITGILIVGVLPIANQAYWMQRKKFEKSARDFSKRYELISSTSKIYTTLFKIHTQFHLLKEKRSDIEKEIEKLTTEKKGNINLIQIQAARLAALYTLRLDLEKERIHLESEVGGISALILNYFPRDIAEQFNKVALLYDERTSASRPFIPTREDPIVKETTKLVGEMAKKVKEYESK